MTHSFPSFKHIVQLPYEEIVDTWPEIFKSPFPSDQTLELDTQMREDDTQPSYEPAFCEIHGISESEYYEHKYESYIQDRFARYGY